MGDTVKNITAKIGKLDKFEGNDFRRWQKKIHFLITTLKYNDDYICHGHILNGMPDALFDVYQNVGPAKELWDQLESKYMAEDASSKKFLVSNFNNYKMVDSSGKGNGKEIDGYSSVNMIEDGKNKNNNKNNKAKKRKNNGPLQKKIVVLKRTIVETLLVRDKDLRILIHHKDDVFAWWIDSGATYHACKDRCWFDTFHLVQDGFVLHMGDESTKPILKHGNVVLEFSFGKTITLVNVVLMPSSNEDQIIETPVETPTVRRSNRARVAKSFGYDFQLYLVEGSRDKIGPQYSYCCSIKEDPRTFDEAMQSRDVAF
ncbi:hypothetical protein Tco_1188057 [Tanacetum coccineum]